MMSRDFPGDIVARTFDEIIPQDEIDKTQRVPYGDHVGRCSQDLWEEYHGNEAEQFWSMAPWIIAALAGASIFGVLLLINRSITTLEAAINGWW